MCEWTEFDKMHSGRRRLKRQERTMLSLKETIKLSPKKPKR